jgi:hypothetical protein
MASMSTAAAVMVKVWKALAAAPYGSELIKAVAAALNLFGTSKLLRQLKIALRL